MTDFQVIATLNRHLLEPSMLKELADNGATIFRINGSHALPGELRRYADAIRKATGDRVKILVDLPGNKIRTAVLPLPLALKAGKTIELVANQFNYPGFLGQLVPGDVLLANDSLYKFRVESASAEKAVLLSFNDGQLTSNKGVHLTGKHPPMPFFFERDHELIRHAKECKLDYLGLSFVRDAKDVQEGLDAAQGSTLRLIVKVETAPAVKNLDEILDKADEFLVDRGDLSCDVGIENVDLCQKLILRRAKKRGKKVYFATQFLHSMLVNNVPLIAEACGLSDAIRCGVDGVQLSEETAVGKYPVEVLKTVQRMHAAAASKFRPALRGSTAPVLWLTGRSASGKSTLTRLLASNLEGLGYRVCVVDGDDFRAFWNNDIGYSKEDRLRNLRDITFTAYQAANSFDLVIVSSLSPYVALRDFAREKIANFHEIFIECSSATCEKRDPEGHYKKAASGEHKNFIGVTEEYEVPVKPELVVDTDRLDTAGALAALKGYVLEE